MKQSQSLINLSYCLSPVEFFFFCGKKSFRLLGWCKFHISLHKNNVIFITKTNTTSSKS
jgi:hypothetical protein